MLRAQLSCTSFCTLGTLCGHVQMCHVQKENRNVGIIDSRAKKIKIPRARPSQSLLDLVLIFQAPISERLFSGRRLQGPFSDFRKLRTVVQRHP
jgi:hypothetical protein